MRLSSLAFIVVSLPHLAHCAANQVEVEGCDITRPSLSNPETLEASARLGDREAQVILGGAYLFGRGVARDEPRGISLLESAAAGGSAEAQYLLGKHFDELPDDAGDNAAVIWYRRAAAKNCPAALFELGAAVISGKGAPQDTKGAFQLFHKAAALGYPPAQAAAGTMMLAGNGTKKDPEGGVRLVRQAAEAGYSDAEIVLAGLYLEGLVVEKNGLEAMRLLEGVYRKQGDEAPTAADILGQIYARGLSDIPEDAPRALHWFALAVAANSRKSVARMRELASRFPVGRITKTCPLYADEGRSKALGSAKKGEEVNVVSTVSPLAGVLEVYVPSMAALAYTMIECVKVP